MGTPEFIAVGEGGTGRQRQEEEEVSTGSSYKPNNFSGF